MYLTWFFWVRVPAGLLTQTAVKRLKTSHQKVSWDMKRNTFFEPEFSEWDLIFRNVFLKETASCVSVLVIPISVPKDTPTSLGAGFSHRFPNCRLDLTEQRRHPDRICSHLRGNTNAPASCHRTAAPPVSHAGSPGRVPRGGGAECAPPATLHPAPPTASPRMRPPAPAQRLPGSVWQWRRRAGRASRSRDTTGSWGSAAGLLRGSAGLPPAAARAPAALAARPIAGLLRGRSQGEMRRAARLRWAGRAALLAAPAEPPASGTAGCGGARGAGRPGPGCWAARLRRAAARSCLRRGKRRQVKWDGAACAGASLCLECGLGSFAHACTPLRVSVVMLCCAWAGTFFSAAALSRIPARVWGLCPSAVLSPLQPALSHRRSEYRSHFHLLVRFSVLYYKL